jgi:16S rRNA processing protein RimM
MQPNDEWMVIGRIVGPFGVHGELKVELHTDFPDRFKGLKSVFVGKDRTSLTVERSRRHGRQVVLKVVGVERPEQADAFREEDIFVPRSEAIELPPGGFFLEDAIGVEVFTVGGDRLGTVSDVLATRANEVFIVSIGNDTVLIPSTKDALRTFDLKNRRMVVEPWVLEPPD